ncbi:MAG: N-acetylmuramoyl-L-alanine amidase [Rubrivivax sp.]
MSPAQRRALLARGARLGSLVLLLGGGALARGAGILAVRVWPAADYTRLTIESDEPLAARHFMPAGAAPRLVVDFDGLELDAALRELVGQVRPDDPYIAGVRVGQFQPRVLRLVIDLKQPVVPEQFALEPVAPYRHRLVFDLRPTIAPDPLLALIREKEAAGAPAPAGPASDALGQFIERLNRLVIVAVDAGHGGEDPGAVGPTGLREKDVVLSVARLLKQRLDQLPGMRAMLTRDGDYFVPLHERVRKARRVKADLFVSIHADAFIRREARGASVFALSTGAATSATARWMADRENAADAVGGVNAVARDPQVLQTLLDMSTSAQIRDSLRIGREMLGHLGRVGRLHKPAVEQAGFAVLKAPDIPSVLVETAFISNPEEEARLRDTGFQEQLADALTRGIRNYFARNPPLARNRSS